MTIRVGTRGSQLAVAQSETVAAAIERATGENVELVKITTTGDTSSAPVTQLGVGVFVNQLRNALHDDEIDVAVHSFKDLPTDQPEDLEIAAVPPRADPRDILLGSQNRTLDELPAGARIGTGSPRRAAQLLAMERGWEVVPIRGNIDSRSARVGKDLDAVVLAAAGFHRVGRESEVTEFIDPLTMLPAPAQGALAVECRKTDKTNAAILYKLNDRNAEFATAAERAILARLEAGCSAPVAALADTSPADEDNPEALDLYLRALVAAEDGSRVDKLSVTATVTKPEEAATVGTRLAEELLDAGVTLVRK
ncbi:hydroxymethylbilane synthase [Haloglycomyces albus]|uniref:hydroxymethylbilane synthase n=1 Tax=Haloglycomyces albus TaxID=526067 RepID=UPI00046D4CF3|nr:hydroxymethylbilane synthase [Haloglycomyces albus]